MSSLERVLLQIASALITEEVLKDHPLRTDYFLKTIREGLKRCHPFARILLQIVVWWIELTSLFFHLKPFSRLDYSTRYKIIKKWGESRWYGRYLFFRPLQVFIYAAYYSNPEISKQWGFEDRVGAIRESPHQSGIQPLPSRDLELSVEICVIGSGAGGAVVAKELAEKGHEVVILEEGGFFDRSTFQNASTYQRNITIYRDGGFVTTVGVPMILLPTGKCVGGTTVINSGTCFRTPEAVFKKWNDEFDLPFSSALMSPYFESVEKVLGVKPVPDQILGGNNRIIKRGIEKLGWQGEPLIRNAPGCQGSGVCIFGCPTGAKQSMERSYLPLAFAAGARLYSHCRVEKLHAQYDRIYKIEASCGRSRLTLYPQKVVLACGTLSTPLLLKRSRLEGGSGQVGKNLTIHPTAKMMGLFDEVIDGHRGVPQGYGLSDFQTDGTLSRGTMYETVFFPPWLMANSINHIQEKHAEIMRHYRHIGVFGFLVHDGPRGRVYSGPGGRPLIYYRLGKREMEFFIKGLKILGQILFAAGAKKVYPTLWTVSEISSPEELEEMINQKIKRRHLESAAFHPLGTCRMGIDPRSSVVNEEMQVHGIENLWIADGSVFPTSLGVNPQITIMAFAARCAEKIHKS